MSKIVDNYMLLTVVGSGQFGDVYRAKTIDSGEEVAIKTIRLDRFKNAPKLHEMTKNEVDILTKIDNPHIIKLLKVLKTQNHIYIIYELCTGGNLEELLDKKKFLSEAEAIKYFKQVLHGCRTLFDSKILHRDLKPSNLLFHKDILKVADFGFCKPLTSTFDLADTMVGSPIYMAPEILKGQPYNMKADLYSLGVVLYEMLYGVCPYEDSTIPGLLNQIQKGQLILHNYNKISKSTENLMKSMLEPLQNKRIDWDELFQHFSEEINIESRFVTQNENISSIMKHENSLSEKAEKSSTSSNSNFEIGANFHSNKIQHHSIQKNVDPLKIEGRSSSNSISHLHQTYVDKLLSSRLKLQFFWRTFKEFSDNNVDAKAHKVNVFLFKSLEALMKQISNKLLNEGIEYSKEELETLKFNQDLFKAMNLLSKELKQIETCLKEYEEFYRMYASDHPEIKILLESQEVSMDTEKDIRLYAEDILRQAQHYKTFDQEKAKSELILANFLIDSLAYDEIASTFFNKSKGLQEQTYLKNLFDWSNENIEEFIRFKLSYYQKSS